MSPLVKLYIYFLYLIITQVHPAPKAAEHLDPVHQIHQLENQQRPASL